MHLFCMVGDDDDDNNESMKLVFARSYSKNTHKCALANSSVFYVPQLYRQVLLRHVLAMGILSVCLSVCHDPVVYQAQVR